MNLEVKKAWIAALRSGEFTQGTGVLRRDSKYCCLGVLCELGIRSGVIGEGRVLDSFSNHWCYGQAEETHKLPAEIMDWAGITQDYPAVDNISLAQYNDGSRKDPCFPDLVIDVPRYTFPEIADLLESMPDNWTGEWS